MTSFNWTNATPIETPTSSSAGYIPVRVPGANPADPTQDTYAQVLLSALAQNGLAAIQAIYLGPYASDALANAAATAAGVTLVNGHLYINTTESPQKLRVYSTTTPGWADYDASAQAAVLAAVAQATAAAASATTAQGYATAANTSVSQAAVAAAMQNFLGTTPAALPYTITGLSGGVSTGVGGTPGTYQLTQSATGPAGAVMYGIVGSGGTVSGYSYGKGGLATTNTVPTFTWPSAAGFTTAPTAPTATVGTITPGTLFSAPTSNGQLVGAWGNNAGTLATYPFGGAQLLLPSFAEIQAAMAAPFQPTRNIFNRQRATSGYYMNSAGTLVASAAYFTTGLVPVVGGVTYTFNQPQIATDTATGYAWFDVNGVIIAGSFVHSSLVAGSTVTAPSNAAFFEGSWRIDPNGGAAATLPTSTNNISYSLEITVGTPANFQSGIIADLADAERMAKQVRRVSTPLYIDLLQPSRNVSGVINSSGTVVANASYQTTDVIVIDEGMGAVLTASPNLSSPYGLVWVAADGTPIGTNLGPINPLQVYPKPAGAIGFRFGYNTSTVNQFTYNAMRVLQVAAQVSTITGTATSGSPTITGISAAVVANQPISGVGIPSGSFVQAAAASGGTITLVNSAGATVNATAAASGPFTISAPAITLPSGIVGWREVQGILGGAVNKKIGVIGDSYSAWNGYGAWQAPLCAELGCAIAYQDARLGRAWAGAFEGYGCPAPVASLSSIGTYLNSTLETGAIAASSTPLSNSNVSPTKPTDGNTLAQNLAGLDLLIIWLGTNDAYMLGQFGGYSAIGSVADTYTAGTVGAAVHFVLDAVATAIEANEVSTGKLTKVLLVSNGYTQNYGGAAAVQAVNSLIVAGGAAYGYPVLNPLTEWGINTISVYSRMLLASGTAGSGGQYVHMNPAQYATVASPAIARKVLNMF